MRVTRFLLAAALCGAVAGCDAAAPRWSDADPPPADQASGDTAGNAGAGEAPDTAKPTRRNTLEVTAESIFFLEGVLPLPATDGTTAALTGAMTLRGQCHDGSMTVVVTGPAGSKRTPVQCDGAPHERELGKVKVGDAISVGATGKAGTDFAIELLAR
jgi:hypothetical protein